MVRLLKRKRSYSNFRSRKRYRATRKIQRFFRKYRRRKYRRRKGLSLKKLNTRVRSLEKASQIKRSYTQIAEEDITDLDLSSWAIDHVPISAAGQDAYGRQANTTKVVGKKFEMRLNFHGDSSTPPICEVKVYLLQSALESPTVPGQIDPPDLAQLYDVSNINVGVQMPLYRMFKLPGSTTDVYKKVKLLKQWMFKLSPPTMDGTGEIDAPDITGAQETRTSVDQARFPVRKWIYQTIDLKNEVFKFGTGVATVPLGPYRYFICATSTAEHGSHHAVKLSGIIKFTYKDD